MSGLEFTEAAARRLEAIYMTGDMAAQRSETLKHLQLFKGEHVIDIGCGPGFLCQDIAETVGGSGRVLGLDISSDLVARAEGRNSRSWLSYRVGDATVINEPDETFDVVACTQVAEYIPDVNKAISETHRVLKAGGRAVFVATDWDALIWHSDVPERMSAVMRCWEAHCAHPRLPRSISARLCAAGFNVNGVSVFPILNLEWGDDTYSKGLTVLIRDFVAGREKIPGDDLIAWENEFPKLSKEGRYFFSSNRFNFRASKPN